MKFIFLNCYKLKIQDFKELNTEENLNMKHEYS